MDPKKAIQWFKANFHDQIRTAIGGTPFSVDMISAVAYQETGYLWGKLINTLKVEELLPACVGDTIDAPGRSAFPKTKAELIAAASGKKMFTVARDALELIARFDESYRKVADRNPSKFCHGYGIFQYDLQFYKEKSPLAGKPDPDFFLNQKWLSFDECLQRFIAELNAALKRAFGSDKRTLTDDERVYVAIAYNRGSVKVGAGFKQGFKDDDGRFYGENVADFLAVAQSIPSVPADGAVSGPALTVERETPIVPLAPKQEAPEYPGHLIKRDSNDTDSVELIQQRLADLGFTQPGADGPMPLEVDGVFGASTADAVELFQTRHTDIHGLPLVVDAEVGSDTWGALFGSETVHESDPVPDDKLLAEVLDVAAGEIGVLEKPPGSNRGERVDEYERSVGIDFGEPWCVAFVFFCFEQAAAALEISNPMVDEKCKTGGVLDLWNRAREASKVATVEHDAALDDPSRVKPGMIFIISTGGGNGHAGLVARIIGNQLETIEGNTNDGGSREGIGVFRRTGRSVDSINRGFIDFAVM